MSSDHEAHPSYVEKNGPPVFNDPQQIPQHYQQQAPYPIMPEQPGPAPVVHIMNAPAPEDGGYNAKCSRGVGIAVVVMAIIFLGLGIWELAMSNFATRGAILFVPIFLGVSGGLAIYAGVQTRRGSIQASMIVAIITAAIVGLTIALLLARIIMEIIVIPLVNSEGPNYYYYYNDEDPYLSFDNGTYIYREPNRKVPTKYNDAGTPYTMMGIAFAIEILAGLAALVLVIITSCLGCRATCCPSTAWQGQVISYGQPQPQRGTTGYSQP